MGRKTQVAYNAVIEFLQTIISTESVEVIMTDFEIGLRNALGARVVNARIAGCHVHYERVSKKLQDIWFFYKPLNINLFKFSVFFSLAGFTWQDQKFGVIESHSRK